MIRFLVWILLNVALNSESNQLSVYIFFFSLYRAVSELAEALRDSDDIKKERNETQKENKDLRERLENVEKTLRMKSQLHRSANGHSHRLVFYLHFTFKIQFFLFTNFLFCFHEFFLFTQP